MARLDWERAAARQRVMSAGGGERLETIGAAASKHVHVWTDWNKPVFGQQWLRECTKCGLVQSRAAKPKPSKAGATTARTAVARVKGPLLIRNSSGEARVISPADASRAASQAVEAGQIRAESGGRSEGFIRRGKVSKMPNSHTAPVHIQSKAAPQALTFEAAARNVTGRSIGRPHGVTRKGWIVAGRTVITCSECDQLLAVIYRPGSPDIIMLCRRCAGAWPLSDYDNASRDAIKQFIRGRAAH